MFTVYNVEYCLIFLHIHYLCLLFPLYLLICLSLLSEDPLSVLLFSLLFLSLLTVDCFSIFLFHLYIMPLFIPYGFSVSCFTCVPCFILLLVASLSLCTTYSYLYFSSLPLFPIHLLCVLVAGCFSVLFRLIFLSLLIAKCFYIYK